MPKISIERGMHKPYTDLGKIAKLRAKHIESSDCWCCPRLEYTDPVNGNQVWVHNEPEDAN